MTDEEYKEAAKGHYEQLCSKNGRAWMHMLGVGSFETWFYVNDGPELRKIVEGTKDES